MTWAIGKPTEWSDSPPPPPREIVEGMLRVGGVTLLVGPEGSAKSISALSLAVAVTRGVPWMGRATERGRVLILDEENALETTLERAYGLGLRSEDREQLRHFAPCGVQLADPERAAAVEQVVAEFKPTLIIVDGGISAGGVGDANDNSLVGRLYGDALIPWAQRHRCAVLVIHHPPKGSDDPNAALGAGAWRRLAAAHFAQRQAQPHYEHYLTEDGALIDRYRYELCSTSKVRWGPGDGWRQRLLVISERDPKGAMRWLRVEPEGASWISRQSGSKPPARARIVEALRDGPLGRSDLAEAVGLVRTAGGFKSAVLELLKTGEAITLEDGQISLKEGDLDAGPPVLVP
jgi:AAA domain